MSNHFIGYKFLNMLQVSSSEYCVLMHRRRTYWLQMLIKIKHSVFKISNNEENVINPANLLSLWSTEVINPAISYLYLVDHWDLNLEFQMLVALRVITTSEWSRSELL